MIKAMLLDFDGTLVTKDMLDVACGIVGKEEESRKINSDFHKGKLTGITPLITRINFLKGVSLTQIEEKLKENSYIARGAKELLLFLQQQGIISILTSGNITPILTYYQTLLPISYIVGTHPKIKNNLISGITEEDFSEKNFKVIGVKKILHTLGISPEETVAIGDSPADKGLFAFAGTSIAVNPKNGIENDADFVITDQDLSQVIPILEKITASL
jgi:phosphoserine phosphatase